jgi:hypothetical protein
MLIVNKSCVDFLSERWMASCLTSAIKIFFSFVVLIVAHVSAIEPNGLEGFPKELIESDNKALFESVTYRGLPPILNNRQSEETSAGTALMVVRTGIQGVESEKLNQLAEQVASLVNNQDLRLVTLSDVNATSEEAKRGAAVPGQPLSFNENQSVVNAALTRGIGLVLFVDLLHFNSKASTVPGAAKLNILNARASLTLLNAADGFRVKAVNREVIARGVDPSNLQDKAFDLLARDLVAEVNAWKVPSVRIKLVELEVHAKMDGIFFPIVDVSSDRGDIKLADVPVFAEDASVEVDGVLKGSAPCRISVTPGTHKLKVYREGTQPFNAVIQVTDSNRYDALLGPTPAFRRRFDEQMEKFERIKTIALKRKAELEAAGVRIEGLRVDNANVRDAGVAKAGLIQSRADVARQTSEANVEMARSEAAALAANTAVKGQVSVLDAESRSKTAEGKLAIEKETAQAKAEMTRSEAAALTARTSTNGSVAVIDAESRAKMAEGSAAVLQGKAKSEVLAAGADADFKRAQAEAVKKDAEGRLAVDNATAKHMGTVLKVRNEMLQAQVDAFRSFGEKLAGLNFKLGAPVTR